MPNPNLTEIIVVLDRSQSMETLRSETIAGFNRFIDDQKKAKGSAKLTLVQFNHNYLPIYVGMELHRAPLLCWQNYVPAGWTALLDAIGRTIDETGARFRAMPERHRPGKVVFVVITDGLENMSKEFTRPRVFEMIEHQRKHYSWEVVFLGANQDAIAEGASIGVNIDNSMTVADNATGTQCMYASVSDNLMRYRSGEAQTMAFSAAQKCAQAEAMKGGSSGTA